MKTTLKCLPCFLNQVLHISSISGNDPAQLETIVREILKTLSSIDYTLSPPHIAQIIHAKIRELLNNKDPYKDIKNHFNRFALQHYPSLQREIIKSPNPFETAVRIAIAGNVIDFGINSQITEHDVMCSIEHFLHKDIVCNHIVQLQEAVNKATKILYLGDNAGEIVFDRLFLEILPNTKITYVVKGSPILNDVTMDDAKQAGLIGFINVIDNGTDLPGTALELCSLEFMEHYNSADLIIAKGQGNFETLNEITDKDIFFLFKVKCEIVAELSNCPLGEIVIKYNKIDQ